MQSVAQQLLGAENGRAETFTQTSCKRFEASLLLTQCSRRLRGWLCSLLGALFRFHRQRRERIIAARSRSSRLILSVNSQA
ncbi:hypothetical protein WT41_01790 [Burkholderia territorii]|nr:hypothetical protein WT41_01790 [Burkholderia territorii]